MAETEIKSINGKTLCDDTARAQATAKYSKPSNGIPKTDLESTVQTSLNKADNAQPKMIQNVNGNFTSTTVEDALDELYSMIQNSGGGTGTGGSIVTENATEVPVASAVEANGDGLVTSGAVYTAITSAITAAIGSIGELVDDVDSLLGGGTV